MRTIDDEPDAVLRYTGLLFPLSQMKVKNLSSCHDPDLLEINSMPWNVATRQQNDIPDGMLFCSCGYHTWLPVTDFEVLNEGLNKYYSSCRSCRRVKSGVIEVFISSLRLLMVPVDANQMAD